MSKILFNKINLSFPVLFLSGIFIIYLSAGCGNGKDDTKKPNIVQDTTPLGKKIGEISSRIGKDPNNADLFNQRAKLHLERLDFVNALTDISRALQIDSTKADYYLVLADAEFARNNSGKTKEALEKCLQLDPNNVTALEKIAELYFYVQDYTKSIAYLDRILKININDPKAYFMKGMNFKEKGDTTRAVGSFQTAIEQKLDYYDAYQQLGILYTAKNDPLGIQYFDGALRIRPKSEEALYGRAMNYQEVKHDYDKAIQDYTSITLINPKNAEAYYALGYIHYQYLKVYSEAIKHYSKAIDSDPSWPEAWYNRGLTYETSGNIAAAKTDYEKAIQLKPGYQLAISGLNRVKQ